MKRITSTCSLLLAGHVRNPGCQVVCPMAALQGEFDLSHRDAGGREEVSRRISSLVFLLPAYLLLNNCVNMHS